VTILFIRKRFSTSVFPKLALFMHFYFLVSRISHLHSESYFCVWFSFCGFDNYYDIYPSAVIPWCVLFWPHISPPNSLHYLMFCPSSFFFLSSMIIVYWIVMGTSCWHTILISFNILSLMLVDNIVKYGNVTKQAKIIVICLIHYTSGSYTLVWNWLGVCEMFQGFSKKRNDDRYFVWKCYLKAI